MPEEAMDTFDLLVIGGGINGTGIARDAAGRGLRVLLVEKADLASGTSGWSSKLIHGGLRYLEHAEFRLVREALEEREVLLANAAHLVRPLLFVLPHDPLMRPVWMVRIGLWLYDHLGKRTTLPGSMAVRFPNIEYSAGLKPELRDGFVYADCRVDDARLTVANAVGARQKGATVLTRTRFVSAGRVDGAWQAEIEDTRNGSRRRVGAKVLVNAAGPWVAGVLEGIAARRSAARVKLVKGSHIVVPKVHSQGHAYLLQNLDKRVTFVIPFEGRYSLVGTTDEAVASVEEGAAITPAETRYLLDCANRFLARPLAEADIVWSYAGVRPLYDDGSVDPASVTRDYVLELDDEGGRAPVLSVYGGKLTTYRRLAETVLAKLSPYLPSMGAPWTATGPVPGGGMPHFNAFRDEIHDRFLGFSRDMLEGLVRRHGTRTLEVLGNAGRPEDLGTHFGAGLTAREVEFLVAEEWAETAEDILWRRTKCGLHMDAAQRAGLEAYLAARGGAAA